MRNAVILVRLRDVILFVLPLWNNNRITNEKAIRLSCMHRNKVVLMQISLIHLGSSVMTNCGNRL